MPGRATIGEGVFGNIPGFFIGGLIESGLGFVGDVLGGAADIAGDVVGGIVGGVEDIASGLLDTAKDLVGGILDGDIGTITKFALPFILPGVGAGIAGAFGSATGVGSFLAGAGNAITNSFAAGILGAGSTSAIATSVLSSIAVDTFTDQLANVIFTDLLGGVNGLQGGVSGYNKSMKTAFQTLLNGASEHMLTREYGGPVARNQAAMVGENGPEVFIPNRDGTVAPMRGSSGDLVIAVNEVRDEISDLRRQFQRALAGGALAGGRV